MLPNTFNLQMMPACTWRRRPKKTRAGSLVRAVLNDAARARNMTHLAREAGMTREGLYKALSENGNPSFATVLRITRALGMKLRITP
jgi:probable addiction module antidote protein